MSCKSLVCLMSAIVLNASVTFAAPSDTILTTTKLLQDYGINDENCRGGSGDRNETWMACGARRYISDLLHKRGWCHGKHGQFAYQMSWHLCAPGSVGSE
jgi:hypothetical protein